MKTSVTDLQPQDLWKYFAALNEVPRPSKGEARVIDFMKNFGESLGLPTSVDQVGNVIIKKPATKGMEDRVTVVLQSHLDMVHQKNADTQFDFDKEGIRMIVDGDWVKADGTTLGADNGIGVASIMAILASDNIPHPAIEALFTIDEETGMTGAMGLKGGLLSGDILLNLDTEDDHELTIGCAGGVDVTAVGSYYSEPTPGQVISFQIGVKGLTGGHSGMDIHLGRGNANKLMNRLLKGAREISGIHIHEIDGGGLRNAIPRESFAKIAVHHQHQAQLENYLKEIQKTFRTEYHTTDPGLTVEWKSIESPANILPDTFTEKLLRVLYACPSGIYRMSPDIPGLVQTSNNLARVLVKEGNFSIQCLTRGSVDSEKMDLAHTLKSIFELTDAKVSFTGAYPGWAPKPEAPIVKIMSDLYQKQFHSHPEVNACHAGLECGILGTNYPEMDMISFGPNIRGAHSPDEKVQISSVQKFWGFLLQTLKEIPGKN